MRRAPFAALAAVAVSLVACEQANEFVAPPPPSVTVVTPVVEPVVESLVATGRAAAPQSAEVKARVSGLLEAILFEEGADVEAGTPLYRIEKAPFEAALDAAKADLERRKAALALGDATVARMEKAAETGAISQQDLDVSIAERQQAAAEVLAAEAAVRAAEIDLAYTDIAAPISGRIDRSQVDAGNLVGADGATLLTTIVAMEEMHVYFTLNERDVLYYLDRRTEDAPAPVVRAVRADGVEYPLPGRIDFGASEVDPESGTLEVRAVFDNPESRLIPGLFIRVAIEGEPVDRMLIPEVALQRDLVGYYVLVVDESNVVHRRNVELGRRFGQRRAVLSGLDPNERVIVAGLQRARPDAPVSPHGPDEQPTGEAATTTPDDETGTGADGAGAG